MLSKAPKTTVSLDVHLGTGVSHNAEIQGKIRDPQIRDARSTAQEVISIEAERPGTSAKDSDHPQDLTGWS